MRQRTLQTDRGDRAKAAGAALVLHLLIGGAFLAGLALHIDRKRDSRLVTFDVEPPLPPPPPPPPPPTEDRHERVAKVQPAGKAASPSAIVAPPTKLPVKPPINAPPVAGQGLAASAGAASAGTGTGAGGTGNGLGGGGNGTGRTGAVLIRGRLSKRDYRSIAGDEVPQGSAMLLLLVNPAGRVERCRPAASSGSPRIDQSLCAMLSERLIFHPAMEGDGRPLYQDVNYVARWGR